MSTFLEELDLHNKTIEEAKQQVENATLLISGAKQTLEHLKKYYSEDDFLRVNYTKEEREKYSKKDPKDKELISEIDTKIGKYRKCVEDLTTFDSNLDKEILGNLSTYNRHIEMLEINTKKVQEAQKLITSEEKAIIKLVKSCSEKLTNCDLAVVISEINKLYEEDKQISKINIAVKKKRIQVYNKVNVEPIITLNDLTLTVGKLMTKLNSYYRKEAKALSE